MKIYEQYTFPRISTKKLPEMWVICKVGYLEGGGAFWPRHFHPA